MSPFPPPLSKKHFFTRPGHRLACLPPHAGTPCEVLGASTLTSSTVHHLLPPALRTRDTSVTIHHERQLCHFVREDVAEVSPL